MIYEKFAYLYDQLMNDAPYDQWLSYMEHQVSRYGNGGKKVLDVGCGTGSIAIPLAVKHFDVTGVDISSDMLAAARQKAERANVSLAFYEQDMRELDGLPLFDVIIVFCDSLNYLQTEEDVKQSLRRFYELLHPQGLLLFDIHSTFKVDEIFLGQTFGNSGEELSLLWQCFQGEYPHSVEHELTFFVLDEGNGLYHRYDETHEQRTFPIESYQDWLSEAGFSTIEITGDFSCHSPTEDSERIFFTAKKENRT
ncbi:class I SAM-dependent DNA methyltransferase [Anaerobacillus sp. MEB173]|uniref:class I SAM-dependent DNA methyltransferase n=1 Tax=Anaerobacillus sp. MEB173 TaxID=3383345 RepID=UPI003F90063C